MHQITYNHNNMNQTLIVIIIQKTHDQCFQCPFIQVEQTNSIKHSLQLCDCNHYQTVQINELYLITARNRLMATPEQKQTIIQINVDRNVLRLPVT